MHVPHEPIVCNDGFTMSVQASSYHYCTPRRDGAAFYTSYEVGFPNACDTLLMPHIEEPWREDDCEPFDPCDCVYPCVPVETVAAIIKKHGGLVR